MKWMQEEDKIVVLTFIAREKKSGFAQSKFKLNEAKKFIDLIIEMGDKYGVQVSKAMASGLGTSQFMPKGALNNEPIERVLEKITVLEHKLETDITKDTVYGLMGLYQKAVEHFALYEDSMVEDFVQRLKSLMERPDIQLSIKESESNKHDDDEEQQNNEHIDNEEEKYEQGEEQVSATAKRQLSSDKNHNLANKRASDNSPTLEAHNKSGSPGLHRVDEDSKQKSPLKLDKAQEDSDGEIQRIDADHTGGNHENIGGESANHEEGAENTNAEQKEKAADNNEDQ